MALAPASAVIRTFWKTPRGMLPAAAECPAFSSPGLRSAKESNAAASGARLGAAAVDVAAVLDGGLVAADAPLRSNAPLLLVASNRDWEGCVPGASWLAVTSPGEARCPTKMSLRILTMRAAL